MAFGDDPVCSGWDVINRVNNDHMRCFHFLAAIGDFDGEGLTMAARFARKRSFIDNPMFKKMMRLDCAKKHLEHYTKPRGEKVSAKLMRMVTQRSAPALGDGTPSTSCSEALERTPAPVGTPPVLHITRDPADCEYYNVLSVDAAAQTIDTIPPGDASCLMPLCSPADVLDLGLASTLQGMTNHVQACVEQCKGLLLDATPAAGLELEQNTLHSDSNTDCAHFLDWLDSQKDEMRDITAQLEEVLLCIVADAENDLQLSEVSGDVVPIYVFEVLCHPALATYVRHMRRTWSCTDSYFTGLFHREFPWELMASIHSKFRSAQVCTALVAGTAKPGPERGKVRFADQLHQLRRSDPAFGLLEGGGST